MSKLTGKVAIVTGASKGIGAAIAKSLAAEGASVVVNFSSSPEGANRVVEDIKSKGGQAIAVQGDVALSADVLRIFEASKQAFGKLDILVNNAGVYEFAPLEEVTETHYHRQFNINVLGTLLATQEALKHFGVNGGSVINLGSIVSHNPLPGTAVYSATKGAVDALTVTFAKELGARKIRVNAIAPGPVVTEGVEKLGFLDSDAGKAIVAQTPLGRFGQPDDIAQIAVFLASDDSYWLTGERIVASGGAR
ncbi:SDR family NAD(P)-dependent oxidoreductase [Aquirhabdus sp.]|uniref:SDR family NAD(P)-dependent oxidoreductase n=1 Tax=Aquirhabdus sp. TaxID=2824160 RepID=UPI00396C989E